LVGFQSKTPTSPPPVPTAGAPHCLRGRWRRGILLLLPGGCGCTGGQQEPPLAEQRRHRCGWILGPLVQIWWPRWWFCYPVLHRRGRLSWIPPLSLTLGRRCRLVAGFGAPRPLHRRSSSPSTFASSPSTGPVVLGRHGGGAPSLLLTRSSPVGNRCNIRFSAGQGC
jgi:hypothetical protein